MFPIFLQQDVKVIEMRTVEGKMKFFSSTLAALNMNYNGDGWAVYIL